VRLELRDGIDSIPVGEEFGVQLSMLENPESTKPSTPFHVSITDERKYLVTTITEDQSLLKTFVMQATQPAQLIFGQVTNTPKQALEPTLIQMRLITRHTLPLQSKLSVKVPVQLGLPEDTAALKCWIDSFPFDDVKCDFSREDNSLLLHNINPFSAIRGGTSLNIELKGLSNRKTAEASDSFEVLTLTNDGYFIDETRSGLRVASNCDWPCWDCPVETPSKCLRCDTREGAELPLFFNGQCLNSCPSNYFAMNGICSQCDAGCLECDKTSKTCHKCHFGMFLLGNTCLSVCPETHHGVHETRTCEPCEKPCKTCKGSVSICTSCDQTLDTSFLFRNKCFEECPRDISVENEGGCLECNPNCKTCDSDFSPNQCTSC